MATPPTFTVGQVLTAAQMNAVGMWQITPSSVTGGTVSDGTTTVTSGSSSLVLNGVFSSDYTNYRVVAHGFRASTDLGWLLRFGSTNTGYFGTMTYCLYSASAYTFVPMNNAAQFFIGLTDSASPSASVSFDIFQPNTTGKTQITGSYYARGYSGQFSGSLENSTQYSSLTLLPETGTWTNGTVSIYGYNK